MIPAHDLSHPPLWGRALLIAAGLHAAAFGALFVRFLPATDATTEMPAIAVELAAPSAIPAPVHDVPTPRQIEAPRQTQQKQPEPKKLPFDPPPPQVADARPEVVLPPKKTAVVKTETANPLPPSPVTTQLASPDLKPDPKTAAPLIDGASIGKATAVDLWDARVRARIELMKQYPGAAVRQNQQDDVGIVLTVDRAGQLLDAHLEGGRGFALLNNAALDAVRRAAPYPKPPKEVIGEPIRLSVIVRFFKKTSQN